MIAMPLMVSTISTGHIFYIIEGFNLEILVWIFGEILETLFIGGQGTLGNYQAQDKLYSIIFLAILIKPKFEESIELCVKSIKKFGAL